MKEFIKKILSQEVINKFYHLPMAILANIIYGFPAKKLKVIGVTGTDGKTTTVNMIYRVLKATGKKVSMVSTINAVVAGKAMDTGFHVTSPDPFSVQKLVRQSLDNGDEYLVLEVTSHAIDQYRFWGIEFMVGIITNITHEHLDYHKTFENYFRTKLKLVKQTKFAVVNQGVKEFRGLPAGRQGFREFGEVKGKLFTFGLTKGDFNQKELKLKLKVPGSYNIENALAALGAAFVLDIDRKIAVKELESFEGITGRMEEIRNNKGIKIFVDFAHTPNALEQALQALRKDAEGRLIAVFGSAGKRDEGKRSLMGEVSGKLADITVVTAEDPRGELDVINKEIVKGVEKAGGVLGKNVFIVEDRKEAINLAINEIAKKGDTVGIFGKGHEKSMNLDGKKEIPWSDLEAAKKVLNG